MTRRRGQIQFCHYQALVFSKLGTADKERLRFAYLNAFKSDGKIGITSVHAALNCFLARTLQAVSMTLAVSVIADGFTK